MKSIALLYASILIVIAGCGSGNPANQLPVDPRPYKYIQSKSETVGRNQNHMDLYVWSGAMNLDTLKMLCMEKKAMFEEGSFYYLAVFDSTTNVTFPTQPFTAEFGLDEEAQRHIRALYMYNRQNGYSKLDYYETNRWESVAQTLDI